MGFLIMFFLVIQTVSGVFLSLEVGAGLECLWGKFYILKEVSFGWVGSYSHSQTPTFLFVFMYLHIFKNFLYPCFLYVLIWGSGVVLFVVFVFLVFTGYSLVFGSMGFWALVVASSLLGFVFGEEVSSTLLLDSKVFSAGVLYKVFTYHYILAVISFVFIFVHMKVLHQGGSSSGVFSNYVGIQSFSFILLWKDFYVLTGFLIYFFVCLYFFPEICFSVENYLEVDTLVVPEEINSEWYLSMFFILLKTTENKALGVFFMFLVLMVLVVKVFLGGVWGVCQNPPSLQVLFLMVFSKIVTLAFYSCWSSLWGISWGLVGLIVVALDFCFVGELPAYQNSKVFFGW